VPLTPYDAAAGAAALHVESRAGAEDWHPVTAPAGAIFRFHGNQCLHWTSENTTGVTRASLDLRVEVVADERDDASPFARGYFVRFCLADGAWARDEPAPPPDYRLGYPFGGIRPAHAVGEADV